MCAQHIDMEKEVVRFMIGLYCNDHHHTTQQALCAPCASLWEYAEKRLSRCPHGETKPFCSHCPHHCYAPQEREAIREVMRYSGPRMLRHRPLLTIKHVIGSLKDKWQHPTA